ncbi:unnamed protein product, partial [marine sediment metagenome]
VEKVLKEAKDKPQPREIVSLIYKIKSRSNNTIVPDEKLHQVAIAMDEIPEEIIKLLSEEDRDFWVGVFEKADVEEAEQQLIEQGRVTKLPSVKPIKEIDSVGRTHIERKKQFMPFITPDGKLIFIATSQTRNFFQNLKYKRLITRSETRFVRVFADQLATSQPLIISVLHTNDGKPTGIPIKRSVNGRSCYEYFVTQHVPDKTSIQSYKSKAFPAGSYIAAYNPYDLSGLPVLVEMRDPYKPKPANYRTILFNTGWNTFRLENRESGMTTWK